MTLDARTVSVTFDPTLAADEAAHRRVLAAAGLDPGFRVHVAELESNAALSVGALALGPAPLRYDLWLANAADGWALQVTASGTEAWPPGGSGQGPPVIGAVPLAHGPAPAQPTFTAGLVPVGPLAASLVLRWGEHRWMTQVRFAPGNPPRLSPLPGDDDETVVKIIARAQTLRERNEAALTLPSGRRLSVLFWKGLDVNGRDFARIASVREGTVIQWTAGAVTRLKTDVPLLIGGARVGTANLGSGLPGAYGLWLQRSGAGWQLLLSNEPDAWGTQHDPAFDTEAVALTYSRGTDATRPFAVALVPVDASRGRIVIHWGVHQWDADFLVGQTR